MMHKISKIKTLFRRIFYFFDFSVATVIFITFLLLLCVRRFAGKIKIKKPRKTVVSLSKDSYHIIRKCNGPNYFDWDFTRAGSEKTYLLYVGSEDVSVCRLGKKIIGINRIMPLEKYKILLPFTIRTCQQILGILISIKIIKKLSAQVIEVMSPSKLLLRALLIKFIMPVKIVTQVRGNMDLIYYFNPFPIFFPFKMTFPIFEIFQVMWDKLIMLLFYRSCDMVIGYNVNNMLSAISGGAHPTKTKLSRIKMEPTILNIDINKKNDILEKIPPHEKIISLWSRLSPEKFVIEAIKSFEKLLTLVPDLHFIIMGNGPEYTKIQTYISASQNGDRIHLLGFKDRNFIAQVALRSSLSLVPYGGGSLLEAVMLGVPVVAFDIEWHNELIRDGETGYLADFPDIEHMTQKMHEVLSDSLEASRRATAAQILARKMFDIKSIDTREAHYYESLFVSANGIHS